MAHRLDADSFSLKSRVISRIDNPFLSPKQQVPKGSILTARERDGIWNL